MATIRRIHYDEDAYAPVGTPFDPLETEEDVAKAKARKDKEHYVLDEQGRRRFHGAFTGGFSAGYYNTVGTKEGWAPTTFRSSREAKAEFSSQKPEDFMDAEDLGAHGIAPREVSTRPNFQQRAAGERGGGGVKRPFESRPSVIPGEAPLQNLIIPARSSVGARLLRSMGWREGQGVGPRVQRTNTAAGEKVYGCSLPNSAATSYTATSTAEPPDTTDQLPEELRDFSFAPRDVSLRQFVGKEDLHGIGYRGMEERSVLAARETRRTVHGMSGEAFGLGALEEEDADENVYGEESMTSYDITLAGEGDIENERKFGWTGGVEDSWSLKSFVKATKLPTKTKIYRAPEVPRDFIPIHRFSILNVKSSSGDHPGPRQPVTVTERSQLLADKPGSVFSLMSAADRERIRRVAAAGSTSVTSTTPPLPTTQTPSSASSAPQPHPLAPPTSASSDILVPQVLPAQQKSLSVGDTEIDNIRPFARNPQKQARYEAFLSGQQPRPDAEYVSMTEWERQRERDEFSRMKRVYQPLSISLSSRFTREDNSEREKEKTPEPDSVQAARADMFGALTREVLEWHPHPVLCKRFDVPDPYPNDGLVGTVTDKHKKTSSAPRQIQFLPVQKSDGESQGSRPLAAASESSFPASQANSVSAAPVQTRVSQQPSVKEGQPLLEAKERDSAERVPESSSVDVEEPKEEARPHMDLFKAIFAESSSSESEPESEKEDSTIFQAQEAAADTMPAEGSVVAESRPRKTRWQNLSEIANRPFTTTTAHHHHSDSTEEEMAAVASQDAAADRSTLHGDDKIAPKITEEKETFGPALPPGFGKEESDGEEMERRKMNRSPNGRHRHHHHKLKKERRRKHKDTSDEEDHRHRKRKEKKKSKHKQ